MKNKKDDIKIDGFAKALEALQELPAEHRARLLLNIAEKNPEIAKKLAEASITFAVMTTISKNDFKVIWWEIERKKWALALRGASTEMMKSLELNLTKRAFEELKSEIAALGPQPKSTVSEAQDEICKVLREMKKAGRISLPVRDKKDRLV